MTQQKPDLVYFIPNNPNREEVTHVGINSRTEPQYIFRTYFNGVIHNHLPDHLKVVPVEQAFENYRIRRGTNIEQIDLGLTDID